MSPSTRILVVDDNAALRENLAEALELEGCVVDTVADGHAALAALGREPLPSVVILDMMMPGLSGPELVGRIRADTRLAQLKIILATGMPTPSDAFPVDAVLHKPFGVAELVGAVEGLLGPSRQEAGRVVGVR